MTEVSTDDRAGVEAALANARAALLASRVPAGHWVGELSSSALSTATASFALHVFARGGNAGERAGECARLADAGARWLAANQNDDGGWGDTTRSRSNISTTALCWAALRAVAPSSTEAVRRAGQWLEREAGSLDPAALSRAIGLRYGKDRTFSVPILTMCAAAGVLGEDGWRHVPQLPFELASLPRSLFAFLRLPVVSYALPALIAIGHVRHRRRPSRNPLGRLARVLSTSRTLRVLGRIQPRGGGFLEATPLTSFVVMSLVVAGRGAPDVIGRGVDFLVRSARPDGSWPIDTNLATWVTTLSVNALASAGRLEESLRPHERRAMADWLLGQQYRVRHPYTGAAPGGWAWTDLPGGVPDADDTAGALLALRNLDVPRPQVGEAAAAGVRWLLGLQNRDGGVPTFCRGWGALPFDRSAPELTAHALLAWHAWHDRLSPPLGAAVERAAGRAIDYLRATQAADGSWTPLWFGNQFAPNDENPTYGTARVVAALAEMSLRRPDGGARHNAAREMEEKGCRWLVSAQSPDGGWGGAPGVAASVEETCQAVHALTRAPAHERPAETWQAIRRGLDWLMSVTDGRATEPAPIGLYFAKLWYWERLYPLIGLSSLASAEGDIACATARPSGSAKP